MLLNTDQDILQETTQHSNEYVVAEQIYRLVTDNRIKIDGIQDYGSEFDIRFHYDTYNWGHQAHNISSYLESCICQFNLPDELQLKYKYTTFDWVNPTHKAVEIKRSGYVVEIIDPEHVDYISWDKAIFTSHNLHIKFRILGERLTSDFKMYGGAFQLCIQDCAYGSTRRIVNILKDLFKT